MRLPRPVSLRRDTATGEPATADVAPVRYTPEMVAAPFDPTVGAALAGAGTDPWSPSYLDPALDIPVKHDSEVARRQDALGSLLWRGLQPDAEPRIQILMPPMEWSLQADDAAAILTAVATTIRAGLAAPRPLTAVIAEGVRRCRSGIPGRCPTVRRPTRAPASTTP